MKAFCLAAAGAEAADDCAAVCGRSAASTCVVCRTAFNDWAISACASGLEGAVCFATEVRASSRSLRSRVPAAMRSANPDFFGLSEAGALFEVVACAGPAILKLSAGCPFE